MRIRRPRPDLPLPACALTEPLVCEVVMGLGCIPLARYGTPGTSELAQTLEPYVPKYDAILMSNHGVVTYGDTLEHAYMKMETVEHFAQIALVTHLLGRQQPLQEVEIEKLMMARTKYFGAKIAASMPMPMRTAAEGRLTARVPLHFVLRYFAAESRPVRRQ